MLYTWNQYNGICQLYLNKNKVGKEHEKTFHPSGYTDDKSAHEKIQPQKLLGKCELKP